MAYIFDWTALSVGRDYLDLTLKYAHSDHLFKMIAWHCIDGEG